MSRILFHGSNTQVLHPKVHVVGFFKDFGYGFYCTELERQAQRWALTKRSDHIINVYQYQENAALNILRFEQMTEEWLDFVTNCRLGIEHNYDIVEGPMADDTIWDYVEDYIAGNISREAFWILVKFKHPTHQIVFCTERALRCLTFQKSYKL